MQSENWRLSARIVYYDQHVVLTVRSDPHSRYLLLGSWTCSPHNIVDNCLLIVVKAMQ